MLFTLLGLYAYYLRGRNQVNNTLSEGQDENVDLSEDVPVPPLEINEGQTSSQDIADDFEVFSTAEEPITGDPEVDDDWSDDFIKDMVGDLSEWSADVLRALNGVLSNYNIDTVEPQSSQQEDNEREIMDPDDDQHVPCGLEASDGGDSDDPLDQGSSDSVLEGHGPAEFSSNPEQTHLNKLIEVYWITRRSQVGEFDQGWSEALLDSGPPGPSLRNIALDPDDPQPGPSGLQAANCKDSDDSQPGSSNLEPATHQDRDDPQPRPSRLEPTPDRDSADPEPAKGQFHLLYDVGIILGEGCFGKVFQGTRIYDGKQVAIKFVRKRSADRLYRIPDSLKPLFVEVALNVLLQRAPRSKHVLQMYEWFDKPKQRILILEHPQPCETLRKFVCRKGGRIDESLACGLMQQAVLGFRHCLDRGVYHNDINMDNILVNIETLQLKLIDFGCGFLLKHAYKDNQGKLSQRKPHMDSQTVKYLGIMLYRMVNGLDVVLSDFDNQKFYVNVSKECRDWINQCLKRDKTKRPTLEQLLGHEWFQQIDGSRAAQECRPVPASI